MRKYLMLTLAVLILALAWGPPALADLDRDFDRAITAGQVADDPITTQLSRPLEAREFFFQMAPQRQRVRLASFAPIFLDRAYADDLTAPPAIAETPKEPQTWQGFVVLMVFAALSPFVTWAIQKAGGLFGMSSKSTALIALEKLADSALDQGALKAVAEDKLTAASEGWHGAVVDHAFDAIWEVGAPFIQRLGWSEDAVKKFLSNELAPAT
jgi:hypothetical protein